MIRSVDDAVVFFHAHCCPVIVPDGRGDRYIIVRAPLRDSPTDPGPDWVVNPERGKWTVSGDEIGRLLVEALPDAINAVIGKIKAWCEANPE